MAPFLPSDNNPLGGVVCGTREGRALGVGHESWHRTARSGTKRPLLVERPIRTVGRVAWPLRRGTKLPLFARGERKTVLVIYAKKLTKLPSGGLNRGAGPSNPQQMPLTRPKRPPKTAHFCSAIFPLATLCK